MDLFNNTKTKENQKLESNPHHNSILILSQITTRPKKKLKEQMTF